MLSRRLIVKAGAATAALGAIVSSRALLAGKEEMKFEVTRSEEEWKKILTPEQYYVLREHGTEYAFSSPLDKHLSGIKPNERRRPPGLGGLQGTVRGFFRQGRGVGDRCCSGAGRRR